MSDYIPNAIQFLIIKELPLKTLMRCRCVCKHWKEFIDSPFLTLHLLPLQKPQFIVQTDLDLYILNLDPLPLSRTLRTPFDDELPQSILIGTLHGVVCLYHLESTHFLLWNPSIHKLSTIPSNPRFPKILMDAVHHSYGFWINPSTKEYKILILLYYLVVGGSMSQTGLFYSSVRKEWSVGDADDNWSSVREHQVGVMIGSVGHWVGRSWTEPALDAILAFDLEKECFQSIEMPVQGLESGISVWEGSLSVMSWSRDAPHRCNIYSRQQDSWVPLFGFNLAPPINMICTLLEGVEGRGVAIGKIWDENGELLLLYDSKSPSVPLSDRAYHIVAAPGYVESLLYV